MENYELIVLDVDGTIVADYNSDLLLPDVVGTLSKFPHCRFALADNSSGVGLRHWMEGGKFGEPEEYPTAESATARLNKIAHSLRFHTQRPVSVYVSFAYQAKSGGWAPVAARMADDPRWSRDWRKPSPGMVNQAMQDAGIDKAVTLMVGDRDEDRNAAHAAGVVFMWADEFFGRAGRS